MIISFNRNNGGGSGSGATYSAGTYIDISEDVISVTGITPDDYLTSADTEDFLTSADTQNYLTSADTKDFITSAYVSDQHYVNSGQVETQITEKNYLTSADTENYVTSAQVKTQVEEYNYVTSAQVETQITGKNYLTSADTENYVTSAQVETQITEKNYITSADTQNYLTSADTKDFITSAYVSDQHYVNSGEVKTQIDASVSGKADAANVSPNVGGLAIPNWNTQGIITGEAKQLYNPTTTINGKVKRYLDTSGNGDVPPFWAPQSAGTAGDILVSTGNGAPVWVTPATINGSAITAGGNIVISGGSEPDLSGYMTSGDAQVISTALNDLNSRVDEISGGSVDLSAYYTSAQTEQAITSKDYVTSAQVETQITDKHYLTSADTQNYVTSAYVETKVSSAFTYINEIEQVTASGYTELHDDVVALSARPVFDSSLYYNSAQTEAAITGKNYVTSAQVETQITGKSYVTSAYVSDALTAYTPTAGFATINGSAITAGGNLVIEGGSGVTPDLSGYMTSGDAQVISTALVDLNDRSLHTVKSTDDSIINIVKIEQSDYNALVSQSATTSTTLYVVVPDSN